MLCVHVNYLHDGVWIFTRLSTGQWLPIFLQPALMRSCIDNHIWAIFQRKKKIKMDKSSNMQVRFLCKLEIDRNNKDSKMCWYGLTQLVVFI